MVFRHMGNFTFMFTCLLYSCLVFVLWTWQLITGLRVEYDLHKPNGKRVVRAFARCGECRVPIYEPIDPNKSYYVIITAFIATGGDGFKVFKQNYQSQQEMGMFTTHFTYWTLQGWAPGQSLIVKFKHWGTTVPNLKLYSWWNEGQISFEKYYHAAWLKY